MCICPRNGKMSINNMIAFRCATIPKCILPYNSDQPAIEQNEKFYLAGWIVQRGFRNSIPKRFRGYRLRNLGSKKTSRLITSVAGPFHKLFMNNHHSCVWLNVMQRVYVWCETYKLKLIDCFLFSPFFVNNFYFFIHSFVLISDLFCFRFAVACFFFFI